MTDLDVDWDQLDAEANAFAIELLMPEEWVRRDAAGVDLLDDHKIERLAKRYRVPNALMAFRLGQLFARTSQ